MTGKTDCRSTHAVSGFSFISVLFLLMVFVASGVTTSAYARTVWRDAVIVAKGDAGFFWMAQHKGFFKKQGLTVKYVQLHGDKAVMRALLSGQVDSAELNPAPALEAMDHGETDLRIIGAPMPGLSYALYVRKDITKWKQLAGKTFGVSAPGSQPDIISREMLARKGVDPNSIKIVNAGGSASRIKALVAGKIDACASGSQWAPVAHKLGIRVMAYAADLVPEYPRMMIIVKEGTLKNRRDATIRFLTAYMQGLQYAGTHRAATLDLSAEMTHKSPTDPTLSYIYHETIARHFLAPQLQVPRKKIAWLEGQLLKTGALKHKVSLDRLIDQSYRKIALTKAHIPSTY